MKVEDAAWAAGLFEGEGTVFSSSLDSPRIALAITDEDVIRKFAQIVGGTVNGPHTSGTHGNKPIYNWQCGKVYEVQRILREFWPYLGDRRRARIADVFSVYYECGRTRRKLSI